MLLCLALVLAACGPGSPLPQAPTPGSAAAAGSPVATAAPPHAETLPAATFTAAVSAPTATPLAESPAAISSPVTPTALPPATATASGSIPSPTPSPPPSHTPSPVPPVADPAMIRVELQPVVGGLDRPLGIAHAGDGSGRLFVLEKRGRIRIVRDGALAPVPFLDITDRLDASGSEQGLLGLVFHPEYARTGFLFVNYTDLQGDTVVARFSVSEDPDRADPNSETRVLSLAQPAANHNGGHLAFGPDGFLYIGTGDGGGAGDRFGHGQNGQTLLGAMLRLDIDRGLPYTIPATNPFVGNAAVRDEIWALGLRNPWRYSFDRATGDLFIADVGQNQYEEINFQPAASAGGQNYGWPIMEGLHCYPADRACDRAGLVLPIHEYDHALGCSVTGGYVYRGQQFPMLQGVYLFGDYCTGRIWGLVLHGDGRVQVAELAQADLRLTSFGQDEAGELYLVDMAGGQLYQIQAGAR
jgi:glucose/arabinose dehydrogenase